MSRRGCTRYARQYTAGWGLQRMLLCTPARTSVQNIAQLSAVTTAPEPSTGRMCRMWHARARTACAALGRSKQAIILVAACTDAVVVVSCAGAPVVARGGAHAGAAHAAAAATATSRCSKQQWQQQPGNRTSCSFVMWRSQHHT